MPCSSCTPAFSALDRLKKLELFSRVRFNQAPVASERAEFTELISQAEKDLLGYEETIAQLQERTVALKNEKRDLSRQVRLAKSLMAPIRQLPPELLREVFIAHGVRNLIRTSELASLVPGFKIASICHYWNSIATDTTALWADICVDIDDHCTESDCLLPLTERLLALSQDSLLSISVFSPLLLSRVTNSTISMLVLLCNHANRWQCLEGSLLSFGRDMQTIIQDTLASIRGHLDNLHTFKLDAPFDCSRWVEGAPKLHTLLIRGIDARSTIIPWNQIVNLDVRGSRVPPLAESLRKMPNLSCLNVTFLSSRNPYDKVHDTVLHSNLKSLKIVCDIDGQEMKVLFESLTLPQLRSLYIEEVNEYRASQDDQTWSSLALPSLISRSSALITSFSLYEVWIPPSNLISLLRIMPALTSLFLSESGDLDVVDPMISDQLLLSMHMHHHHDQQPILTRLISLNLEVNQRGSFSIPTFVEMIHSRWKPAYLNDDIACIKTVRLHAWDSAIALKKVDSLVALWKTGLDIMIKDRYGVVIPGREIVE